MTNVERFWSHVDKDGPVPEHRPELGPCWLWTAAINKLWGYGYIHWNGKFRRAHIVSVEIAGIERIPKMVLDHLCRVRHCVRPTHLEQVTQAVNCQRGETGRAPGTTGERNKAKTQCPAGHPYAGANLKIAGRRRHCRACARARSVIYEQTRGRHRCA